MPKCSFSGKEIPIGTGVMYVKKDGKVLWFADSKAYKNHVKLGRKARTTKWTGIYHQLKQERLSKKQKTTKQDKKETKVKNSNKKESEKGEN